MFLSLLGANTLTFIIPAEIFPTSYRCTCHGISAAAGKLGSIVAVLVVFGINKTYKSPNRQGLIFLLFGSVAVIGAFFSWAYLPDPQRTIMEEDIDHTGRKRRTYLETKNLEELGQGRVRARLSGEGVTPKERWAELKQRRRHRSPGQDLGNDNAS